MIKRPFYRKKVIFTWAIIIWSSILILNSCKKKDDTAPPVVNTYTVKYQVRYVGCPTTTPFIINYQHGGENHTAFVAVSSGELVKYWNLEFSAKTGDYVYLKCTPPFPPQGYTTLATVSIEAIPSSPSIFFENTASYPGMSEVEDTLP